ncbi:MAG: hypothetical protein JWS10_4266 [Cypionkella sp.]|nr:hypothetical protein [Cypionkella sp.]
MTGVQSTVESVTALRCLGCNEPYCVSQSRVGVLIRFASAPQRVSFPELADGDSAPFILQITETMARN